MRTYNVKLKFEEKDKNLTIETLQLCQKAFNIVSNYIESNLDLDMKSIHQSTYNKIRTEVKGIPAQYAIKMIKESFSAHKSMKSNGEDPFSECKRTKLSSRLDKRLCTIREEENGIFLLLTTAGGKGRRSKALLLTYPKFLDLFNSCQRHDPLIFERGGDLWLSVSFDLPEKKFVPGEILGVDLGQRRLAVTSEGKAFVSKEHNKSRRKIRYLKRELQAKDTKSAKRRLKKVKRKERNISKDSCHKLANAILESTKCTTIAMEDLSGIKDKKKSKRASNARSQISYYELKRIMEYKAQTLGKRVATVSPAYTSQNDHRGHMRGDRKGCRYYSIDGRVWDSDWNAAINIALRLSQKAERPASFSPPFDGGLNFAGRETSASQS